ncbi:VSP [Giardia duodenalis ATCC 50581]|nr:VSP [Giardia intestinalis ATCC 50581]
MCVLATARELTAVCTPKNDGTCESCKDTYFLQSGGCYQSMMYPGDTLCELAQQGKCTTCANLQLPERDGSCPLCATNCKVCDASNAKTCRGCFPGYYLDSVDNKCVKCTDNSNNNGNTIVGIPNCISCVPPASGNGPVTCYVVQESTNDPTDLNTNKGSFSTGAIAGISVVAVLVVGALIGFLCWWFLCKTKHAGVSSSTTALTRPTSS